MELAFSLVEQKKIETLLNTMQVNCLELEIDLKRDKPNIGTIRKKILL